jgi:hypothetical protein
MDLAGKWNVGSIVLFPNINTLQTFITFLDCGLQMHEMVMIYIIR